MALFRRRRDLDSPTVRREYGGDWGVAVADMGAAQLYRSQPNLRAVVSFLADNAAQVPLKVHERADQNDRPRVTDSAAALLLQQPNADMTPFEFKRWMYSDLLLYERFLALVIPSDDTASGWELRPVPNAWIRGYNGRSPFAPETVDVASPGNPPMEVPADKFILFHGYDPTDPMRQYSRISALKETLHEQVESNRFRRQMWHRGGRFNAYLTRPKDVQSWSEAAFERFKEGWKASWAGGEASEGGGMPILEDGMEIKTVQFNSRDAQWADSVKLSREDVAGVYHVNPALIWPGSGQTYASARDNARALYNDTLAPLLMQATDRINMSLLPMVGEPESHYVIYDITIKTQGTLEERISALQTACGGPFMTREEVRALIDLPREPDGELIVPMNVVTGGLASNHDTDPTRERYNAAPADAKSAGAEVVGGPKAPEPPASRKARGDPAEGAAEELEEVYRRFFERQRKSVVPKIESGASNWWNAERWDSELAADLYPVALAQADAAGEACVARLWPGEPDRKYGKKQTAAYVSKMCRMRAEAVNAVTRRELAEAVEADGKGAGAPSKGLKSTVAGVFAHAILNRSRTTAGALACALVGFATMEAVSQNRRRGENVYKTWRTTSGNPRASHARLNGETVQYDQPFSNGMMWPGDWKNGSAAEVAHCRCVLDVEVREKTRADTVRGVVDALGIEGEYSEARVYAAYAACSETVGEAATEVEIIAEMRTRDIDWVKSGKKVNVEYATADLEAKVNAKRPHEVETGKRLAGQGVPTKFQVDERRYFDEKKQLWQRVGKPDLENGYELKTLHDAGWNSVDGYIRKTVRRKEGVEAIVIDNFENVNPITDGELIDHLKRQQRWSGKIYIFTRDGKYLRVK